MLMRTKGKIVREHHFETRFESATEFESEDLDRSRGE